jgi:hypothetical protein
VSDEGPGDTEHARIPHQWAIGQLRKLPVVASWQIQLDLANLPLDEMIIVDQPFRSWGYRVPRVDRRGDGAMGIEQHSRVVGEPARERQALGQPWCHRLRNS